METRSESHIFSILNSLSRAGDELLSDSFPYEEIENGMLWEVEGKVITVTVIISCVF